MINKLGRLDIIPDKKKHFYQKFEIQAVYNIPPPHK